MRKRRPSKQELLRKDFEAGDPLALNRAYLAGYGHQWIKTALHDRLRRELDSHERKRAKRGEKLSEKREGRELLRWYTFNWFRRQGVGFDASKRLAAEALGGLGESTIAHAYNIFHKKQGYEKGLPLVRQGFEAVNPEDLLNPDFSDDPVEYLRQAAALKQRLRKLLADHRAEK
jgi:hypothetical protein